MNKNKLIITIICFVLIGFIAAASIGERNKKSHTEYITIVQSGGTATAAADAANTTPTATKHKKTTTAAKKAISEAAVATEPTAAVTESLFININIAGHDELVKLPYIGDTLADNIIAYRENNGVFRNIEEIMLVSGISDGIFSHICDSIYVDDPVYEDEIIPDTEENTDSSYEPGEKPTEPPAEEVSESAELTLEDVIPIDLNSADAETLMLLPYISEEAAIKIIELRDTIGYFSHPYEIYYAEVLEPYQIEEICEYVTVKPYNSEEAQHTENDTGTN